MISVIKYPLPAADMGKKNPLPDFKNVGYIHAGIKIEDSVPEEDREYIGKGGISTLLPYMMEDGYNRERKLRDFNAVKLENEHLIAVFVPELGGRLWSLYDKDAKRELLYKNPVFQPANLALRNAWFSGGVEFNVGIRGHNPLTCSPLFAEIITLKNGEQELKMYEYERIRNISYCIRARLPKDSKLLYIRQTVENNTDDEKYSYWWTNIAVPETEKTRVIVPAPHCFASYNAGGYYPIALFDMPNYEGADMTYPANAPRAHEYFFRIPKEVPKWIAAVDKDGYGLLQFSDEMLKGRKLFIWGKCKGGRRWNEWLSDGNGPYVEIQAGLTYTQHEHIPMKPHEAWEFTEAYGAVKCDSIKAHSEDWDEAINSVTDVLGYDIGKFAVPDNFDKIYSGEILSSETVCTGSGWGALENKIRAVKGKEKVSKICAYPETSFGKEEKPWLYLLENGVFPDMLPSEEPTSYMTSELFADLLKKAAETKSESRFYALMQLAVYEYAKGDVESCAYHLEESIKAKESPWASRNLAMIYLNEKDDPETAKKLIRRAIKLKNDCVSLDINAAKILVMNGEAKEYLKLYEAFPDFVKQNGRMIYYKAKALLDIGNIEAAANIITKDFVLSDIQEGEISVSDLWESIYFEKVKKETGLTNEEEIRKISASKYPVPYELDFRMYSK